MGVSLVVGSMPWFVSYCKVYIALWLKGRLLLVCGLEVALFALMFESGVTVALWIKIKGCSCWFVRGESCLFVANGLLLLCN